MKTAEEFLKEGNSRLYDLLNSLLGIYDRGVLLNDCTKAMEAYASQSKWIYIITGGGY